MVLLNLSSGQEQGQRHRERSYSHREGKGKAGRIERATVTQMHSMCETASGKLLRATENSAW